MITHVQVSLDLLTIDAALDLAAAAVRAGVDWLEAGTPLLLAEGQRAVTALRDAFPGVPIVADIKAMDGGGLETEMMLRAGATMVVVMGQAHDATIAAAVAAARRFPGAQIVCDLMLCPNKPLRARQVEVLGVHAISVHTGYDERTMHAERTPLDDLAAVVAAVSIPVQAVGGLSVEQALATVRLGARSVVFGAPLAIAGTDAHPDAENRLRDVVHLVRALDTDGRSNGGEG